MPMGQYPGNPANYPVNIGLPDDSDVPDASEFAVGYQNLADRTAFLASRVRGLAAMQWPFPQGSNILSADLTYSVPVWDAYGGRFCHSMSQASGAVSLGFFSSNLYPALSPTICDKADIKQAPGCIIPNPTTGDIVVHANDINGVLLYGASAWSSVTTDNTVVKVNSAGCYFDNLYVCAQWTSVLNVGYAWSADGVTWTSVGGATTLSINPKAFVVVNGTTPQINIFYETAGATTYIQSLDGKTFTSQAMPIVLGGNEIVAAACWDPIAQSINGGIYGGLVLLLSDFTANTCRVVVNGVVVYTAAHRAYGIATDGGCITILVKTKFGTGVDTWQLVFTIDQGVTWNRAFAFVTVEPNMDDSLTTHWGLSGGDGCFAMVQDAGGGDIRNYNSMMVGPGPLYIP